MVHFPRSNHPLLQGHHPLDAAAAAATKDVSVCVCDEECDTDPERERERERGRERERERLETRKERRKQGKKEGNKERKKEKDRPTAARYCVWVYHSGFVNTPSVVIVTVVLFACSINDVHILLV